MSKSLPQLTPKQAFKFGLRIKRVGECWEWQGSLNKGYGQVSINKSMYKAHRVAYYLGTGIDPGEKLGCHSCDNPRCCRPSHVFAGTPKENSDDCTRKGRQRRRALKGATNPNAKLTDESAKAIKYSTEPNTVLAKRYGISAIIVGLIKQGKRWAHI